MKNFILGNGVTAHDLYEHLSIKSNISIDGYITISDGVAYEINDRQGITEFSFAPDCSFYLGTLNKNYRIQFIDLFSSIYELNEHHFPNYVANYSCVSALSSFGVGNIIMPFTSIAADTKLGHFNFCSTNSSIGSNSKLGSNNILSPYSGVLNKCTLGDDNFLAANAIITPKITIGDDNTISAGECVFDDLNDREFFQSGIILPKDKKEYDNIF